MTTIVTRAGKGSPLTHNEVDANFTNLNADKVETSALNELIDDRVAALVVAGTNMTVTYNDGAGTLTFDAASGGGGVSDGDKGDIIVTGTGATWTIDAGVVTLAKMADMATSSLIYRKTAGSGAPEVNTLATLKTDLGLTGTNSGDQTITLTGDVTGSGTGSFATTIAADAVTFAKMQNIGTDTLIGRDTASTGDPEAITVTGGIEFSGSGSIRTSAFTGDATKTAGGTALTLATVNSNVGSFGSATQVATFTVNGKGLTTAAANVSISIPMTAISDSTAAGRSVLGAASATAQTALFDVFTSGAKGLAPASGGGTTNFLRADGTWAAPGGGGGGTPGGSTTQIQFNDAGAFGGDADLTWDKTTNTLGLVGADTGIELTGITNEPSAPSSGNLRLYSKSIAGRMVAKVKGPSGIDTPLQSAFWQNNIMQWSMTTATAGAWFGTSGSSTGTFANTPPSTTNLYTASKRSRYSNVVTTLNQVLGLRNNELTFFRGNAAGQGGFFFFSRFGFDTWTNGSRFFSGMHTASTVISADPSALNNTCGFAVDAADNGLIHFLTRGTSATKASTGFTIVNNKGYDVFMFCAPNSSEIHWRIVDFVAGTEASGTATANLPAATTTMGIGTLASNAALTPANSVQMGVMRIYAESDY